MCWFKMQEGLAEKTFTILRGNHNSKGDLIYYFLFLQIISIFLMWGELCMHDALLFWLYTIKGRGLWFLVDNSSFKFLYFTYLWIFNSIYLILLLLDCMHLIKGGPMKLEPLDKAQDWVRSNQDNNMLNMVGLYNLEIVGHVQINFSFLTSLVEWWELDSNTFHLPTSEMTVTLLYVYKI